MQLSNGSPSRIKILLLGQCLLYGYGQVGARVTFPNIVKSMLQNRFPGVAFGFDLKFLYHPIGLKALLRHRLLFSKPDVAVISLPAMFASTTWRVNRIYEMAPELVDTARSFLQTIEKKLHRIEHPRTANTMLDKAFAIRPPMSIEEYENAIRDAIEHCRQIFPCRFILMGPGRFNEDTNENLELQSPELYRSVNEMVLGVGRKLNIPVINAQEALEDHGREVFIPQNHRWSPFGHEVIAKEVEAVIAKEVIALSKRV